MNGAYNNRKYIGLCGLFSCDVPTVDIYLVWQETAKLLSSRRIGFIAVHCTCVSDPGMILVNRGMDRIGMIFDDWWASFPIPEAHSDWSSMRTGLRPE